MPSVTLLNQTGKKAGTLELSQEVFGYNTLEDRCSEQVVFDTVIAQRAGMRQGTQKAKTRTEVSGGGKKPWRQKGTGRARQGSIRSPQWVGGGVVFAPVPRSHAIKVNKKVVMNATKWVLSNKLSENKLIAVKEIKLEAAKTKELATILKNVKAEGKILVVLEDRNDEIELAGRNIPNALVLSVAHASVYELLDASVVVATKAALEKYEEVLR